MSAITAKLSRVPSFNIRGVFAVLFAVELRAAVANGQRDEGAYRWGL